MIARVHRFLTTSAAPNSPRTVFWFSLSLTFALLYGIFALKAAFSSNYLVQNDARMYVFWLQRFIDPDILPNDLNVAYHSSISPPGYTGLYYLMAKLGVEPLLLSKLLPIAIGIIATIYCFGLCLQIFPVPTAAFIATLLMNQGLWLKDDLTSATPRAFVYPFFLAFLYYLLRGSLISVMVAIALLGLFYPPMMFIAVGILIIRLGRWDKGRLRFSPHRYDYLLCAAGLGVAGIVTLPYVLSTSEFGPLVTAAQAKNLPEFSTDIGRIPYFHDKDAWAFWCKRMHSGFRLSINPPLVAAGFLLPLMRRYPSRFPAIKHLNPKIILLTQILLVSFCLYFAAHLLLFRLFMPSRYTAHSLLILMAITGGIALCVLLDAILHACEQPQRRQGIRFLVLGSTALVAAIMLLYPNIFWKEFADSGYFAGRVPALYEFFQKQPKNIVIASLTEEANNLPVFSQRSILVGWKYAIPFHLGYYNQIRQRATDLIRAQYSPNQAEVQNFIQKYKVDFWLVERQTFEPSYLDYHWYKLFEPARSEARNHLEYSHPALAQMMKRCSILEVEEFVVLQAKCLSQAEQ